MSKRFCVVLTVKVNALTADEIETLLRKLLRDATSELTDAELIQYRDDVLGLEMGALNVKAFFRALMGPVLEQIEVTELDGAKLS